MTELTGEEEEEEEVEHLSGPHEAPIKQSARQVNTSPRPSPN